jgi:uncharacterized protein
MQVAELWRYPVKSLQGERLDTVRVTADGLEGDRGWALYDVATGFGLTARRVPELLFASARLRGDGTVEVRGPDGEVLDGDDALSAWLGRPVTLESVESGAARRYEDLVDPEAESGRWQAFEGPPGPFHDSRGARVSLVSRATVDGWDPRRFRANVLLDGEGEDAWVGSSVALGSARLDVGMRIGRCVMVTRPQPGGIGADPGVLRTIARERQACLAVGALVARPGTIGVGDAVAPA